MDRVYTQEDANILRKTINYLESTKSISQQDVLSLEEAIKENIITNNNKISMFTSTKSGVNYETTVNTLKFKLNEINAGLLRRPEKLLEELSAVKYTIKNVLSALEELYENYNRDILNTMLSDTYSYVYENRDNIEILVDLREQDFLINIITKYDYLISFCKEKSGDYGKTYDKVYSHLDMLPKEEITQSFIPLPIWSTLMNVAKENQKYVSEGGYSIINGLPIEVRIVTLQDIKEFFTNFQYVRRFLEDLSTQAGKFGATLKDFEQSVEMLHNLDNISYMNIIRVCKLFESYTSEKSVDKIFTNLLTELLVDIN